VRSVEETDQEKAERDKTKSENLIWYRNGREHIMDEEKNMASLCLN
jgi:hypothetical protein